MERVILVASALALVGSPYGDAGAQSIGGVFERVSRSVVVIRTLEREVAASDDRRLVSVPGQGSGVIISADGKVLTAAHVVDVAEAIHEFLQTDAAINQGNSGGPMFSMAGEVIGVVSHNISKSGGSEGLGFVVTSNLALDLLQGRRARWWGFEGELIAGDLLRVFNLPEPGLLVQRVVANSPAETLGLRGGIARATVGGRTLTVGGDIILRVQGVSCGETHRVRDTLNKLKRGDRLTVMILREGQRRELTMTVP